MTRPDTYQLIRQLIGGDATAIATIRGRAATSVDAVLLVAAALEAADRGDTPAADDLLARAGRLAVAGRDRQLVAIASSQLAGEHDRSNALAREHLAEYPDSLLVAWIAYAARSTPSPG
jgi:hypothetical protein